MLVKYCSRPHEYLRETASPGLEIRQSINPLLLTAAMHWNVYYWIGFAKTFQLCQFLWVCVTKWISNRAGCIPIHSSFFRTYLRLVKHFHRQGIRRSCSKKVTQHDFHSASLLFTMCLDLYVSRKERPDSCYKILVYFCLPRFLLHLVIIPGPWDYVLLVPM